MESYIVRIYRRTGDRAIIGILIEPVSGVEKTFHNIGELMALFKNRKPIKSMIGATSQRRSYRMEPTLSVAVRGTDVSGKSFTERTEMKNISPFGGLILLKTKVKRLAVLNILIGHGKSSEKVKGKVVHIGRSGVGVEFATPLKAGVIF